MRTPSTTAVKHWFDYIQSGQLIWKHSVGTAKKGDTAGYVRKDGYLQIKMQGVVYLAHRLIWVWHGNKLDPDLELDHIDRDKLNNRIENLQQITHGENNTNRKTWAKLGTKCIYETNSARRPYRVVVKRKHIGSFSTREQAEQALECFLTNNEKPDVRQPS